MPARPGSGKKPLPAALRLLKNDKAHAHRYVNKNEPQASDLRPVAPSNLSERGKEIFDDFVDRIEEMYPASESDLSIILLYVENQEELEANSAVIREFGSTYTSYGFNKDGEEFIVSIKKRPECDIVKSCRNFAKQILVEFGMSPSSRSRIDLPKKPAVKKNSFADLDDAVEG